MEAGERLGESQIAAFEAIANHGLALSYIRPVAIGNVGIALLPPSPSDMAPDFSKNQYVDLLVSRIVTVFDLSGSIRVRFSWPIDAPIDDFHGLDRCFFSEGYVAIGGRVSVNERGRIASFRVTIPVAGRTVAAQPVSECFEEFDFVESVCVTGAPCHDFTASAMRARTSSGLIVKLIRTNG